MILQTLNQKHHTFNIENTTTFKILSLASMTINAKLHKLFFDNDNLQARLHSAFKQHIFFVGTKMR